MVTVQRHGGRDQDVWWLVWLMDFVVVVVHLRDCFLPDADVSEPDTVSEDELDHTFQQSNSSSDDEVIEEDDASTDAKRKSYTWHRRPFNPETEPFTEADEEIPSVLRPIEDGIHSVATIRSNRLRGCPVMPSNELKRKGRGATDFCCTRDNKLCVVKWFDNREVILTSTYKCVDPVEPVRRWDKRQRQFIDVPCPQIVKEYNQFMRGVDLTGMLISLYRIDHKCRKWHRRVFFWAIHVALTNSWVNLIVKIGSDRQDALGIISVVAGGTLLVDCADHRKPHTVDGPRTRLIDAERLNSAFCSILTLFFDVADYINGFQAVSSDVNLYRDQPYDKLIVKEQLNAVTVYLNKLSLLSTPFILRQCATLILGKSTLANIDTQIAVYLMIDHITNTRDALQELQCISSDRNSSNVVELATMRTISNDISALPANVRPQAEASPIDKEGTLRNTDWLEADRTRKAEARFRHGNKRLTPPIMTRFDDVNKKVQKGATLSTALQFGKVV
ncbi:PiggyBac transposable element-derived protein [Trichinella pseudospiralis]